MSNKDEALFSLNTEFQRSINEMNVHLKFIIKMTPYNFSPDGK